MRYYLLSLLLALSLNPSIGLKAAEVAPVAGPPGTIGQAGTDFVIGISPYLDKSVKDEVYRSLVRLLVEDLPLNSSLAVYDAFDLKSIAHVTLPNARAFNSSKTRANQFAPAIRELKQFLAQEHPKPAVSHLDFQSALRLPQFCDFLTENLPHPGLALTVLLIGSPLYQDAKEPAFSMVDGYFPSDGHLQASREQSVFGVAGETKAMAPLRVHWVYCGDPWVNDLHKERVTRFWTLYFDRRAGRLLTLTGDLPSALERFRHGGADESVSTRRWAVDPSQTKVEMLRINRDVELTDWLTSDARAETAQPPPATMVGPLKIGIRWKRNIDLDLYATPRRGAETLFFQHPRSPDGYYYKDHRSSPGREYEFIEFETPVDIRELEAFVNFYKGSCPGGPRGEVRIEFDGRIYGGAFAIPASDGNLGRTGAAQQDCWVRIPVRKILKIEPTTTAGR